jgi:hypothetical protein
VPVPLIGKTGTAENDLISAQETLALVGALIIGLVIQ